MISMLRRLLAFGLIVALMGCSSSGTIEMKQAKTTTIPPGKVVALNVTAPVDDDSTEALHRMRGELFGRLVSEGVFKQVVPVDESADYRMEVNLSNVEEVSQGARIFFGVLAGANELRAAVKVTDSATNQVVTQFAVAGESASHPLSTESGLDDAIREAASKIIGALK